MRPLQSGGTIRVQKRCYLSAFGEKVVRNGADNKRAEFSKTVDNVAFANYLDYLCI